MRKSILIMAGVGIAGYYWFRNREEVEARVRRTAKKIRKEIDPIEERITEGLDDLARTLVSVNKRIQSATRVIDSALQRLAA